MSAPPVPPGQLQAEEHGGEDEGGDAEFVYGAIFAASPGCKART
jgi:hypothetical protein